MSIGRGIHRLGAGLGERRHPLDEHVTYIKRVIGLPGDLVQVQDNQIVLNGVKQQQSDVGPFTDVDGSCRPRKAVALVETLEREGGAPLSYTVLRNQGYASALASGEAMRVPADAVFVLGDNRDHSEDSRRWGLVRYGQILGRAEVIGLSWDPCEGQLRTDRLGVAPDGRSE